MRWTPVRSAIFGEAWHWAQVVAIFPGWIADAGSSRPISLCTGPWQVWQGGLPEISVKTGWPWTDVFRLLTASSWQVAQSTFLGSPVCGTALTPLWQSVQDRLPWTVLAKAARSTSWQSAQAGACADVWVF